MNEKLRTDSQSSVFELYFEYSILNDRPGILGDVASLLGMLGFNIVQTGAFSGVSQGLLITTGKPEKAALLESMMVALEDVELAALRPPSLRDRISLRHGHVIERSDTQTRTYRFVRDELGMLVDFLGELLKRPGHHVIGLRGQPRVGKTESIVAASVYANKRWVMVSSTLLKHTVLDQLSPDILATNAVYVIDGAVSMTRGNEAHRQVVDEVLRLPAPVVIEHPDAFVRHFPQGWSLFDCILELRRHPDEEIVTDWIDIDSSVL